MAHLGFLALLGDLGWLLSADMSLLKEYGRLLRFHVDNHRLEVVRTTVLLRVLTIESLVKLARRFSFLRHLLRLQQAFLSALEITRRLVRREHVLDV